MRGGNFASLTDCLLVRKDKAEPSPATASAAFRFAQDVVSAPVDGPTPTRSPHRSKRRELPATGKGSDVPAKPRRTFVLSAGEYEALGLVADKKGTTPQDLLRKMLRQYLVELIELGEACRY